jgi:hypothetical protein
MYPLLIPGGVGSVELLVILMLFGMLIIPPVVLVGLILLYTRTRDDGDASAADGDASATDESKQPDPETEA